MKLSYKPPFTVAWVGSTSIFCCQTLSAFQPSGPGVARDLAPFAVPLRMEVLVSLKARQGPPLPASTAFWDVRDVNFHVEDTIEMYHHRLSWYMLCIRSIYIVHSWFIITHYRHYYTPSGPVEHFRPALHVEDGQQHERVGRQMPQERSMHSLSTVKWEMGGLMLKVFQCQWYSSKSLSSCGVPWSDASYAI